MATATLLFSDYADLDYSGRFVEMKKSFYPPSNISGRSCYLKVTNVSMIAHTHGGTKKTTRPTNVLDEFSTYFVTVDLPQPYSFASVNDSVLPIPTFIELPASQTMTFTNLDILAPPNTAPVFIPAGKYTPSQLALLIKTDLELLPAITGTIDVVWDETNHYFVFTTNASFQLEGDLCSYLKIPSPTTSSLVNAVETIIGGTLDHFYDAGVLQMQNARNNIIATFTTGGVIELPDKDDYFVYYPSEAKVLSPTRILVEMPYGPQDLTFRVWKSNGTMSGPVDNLTVMCEATPIDTGYTPDIAI